MSNTELLKHLHSRLQSLERQLESCHWTDKEMYQQYLDIEDQIEKLEKE